MKQNWQPKFGIEIEFAMDIEILKRKLDENNITYSFMENPRLNPGSKTRNAEIRRRRAISALSDGNNLKKVPPATLVVKPDRSVGELNGWELNFPPTYTWEDVAKVLDIVRECRPVFPDTAALHVHVDTYMLSQYNVDQIHTYYYLNQEQILQEAKAVGLYADLNQPLPEELGRLSPRKTNLNIKSAMRRHNTIEHRIYKSTIDIDEVKWCVEHTINIFKKAMQEIVALTLYN